MLIRRKSCLKILLTVFAVLAALWTMGNMMVEVGLDGQDIGVDVPVPAAQVRSLRDVFQGLPGTGVAESKIELLEENQASWAARWLLLAEARETLDVSYFILDPDIFGISFLGHLLHKANSGVRVRVLLDAIGTSLSREIEGNDYLHGLANAGNVTIKMYRPYLSRFRDAFLTLNPLMILPSDHDKILIADGRRSLVGGRNIGREYLADPLDYPRAFRDADALFSGREIGSAFGTVFQAGFESAKAHDVGRETIDIWDSAEDLILAYEAMDAWLSGRTMSETVSREIRDRGLSWLDDLAKLPRLKGALKKRRSIQTNAEVRLLDSRPRLLKADDAISKSLDCLVGAAREEIFIQVPYVILSSHSVSVLEKAAARGVRITIYTNSPVSTDNPLSQAFFLEQWPDLLARLPTLRLFVAGDGHNVHAKLGAIDGTLALIGTYNLDPVSMSMDGELIAAIWSRRFSARLLSEPKRLIAQGAPVVFEYRIARDSSGLPERDRDGKIVVAFGPEDHSSPDQWKTIQWYRNLLRIAAYLPGTAELLWQYHEEKTAGRPRK